MISKLIIWIWSIIVYIPQRYGIKLISLVGKNHEQHKPLLVQAKIKKKNLVLDLDETLVHSTININSPYWDECLTLFINGRKDCTFYVKKRPHLDFFFAQVCQWYDVFVFTASVREYADPLIDKIDPKRVIKKRFFRDSCICTSGSNYIKDLSFIGMDLSQTVIIDNSPIAYDRNKENAIPIENFWGTNIHDEELLNMIPFLDALRFTSDVRSILGLRLVKFDTSIHTDNFRK